VERAEVVVVGAGPSGAATALLLARHGHDVVVVDRARFPRDKACGEGLLPPGVNVVQRLGLLDKVLATGARPLLGVAYRHSLGGPAAHASFPSPPAGEFAWGLGVRRTTFDAVLVNALRDESHVTLREGEQVTGLVRNALGVVCGVATDTDQISARAVIAADGLHSRLRSWAGLTSPAPAQARYGLAGHWRIDVRERREIVVTLGGDREWYEAPVAPDLLLVSVLAGRSRPPVTRRTYAAAARSDVPGIASAQLVSGPLGAAQFLQRARTVADGGVFLVGDAAGYDDPTTGEGLAIGLLLAEALAQHIDDLLCGRVSSASAALRYRADHHRLWRDRRRLTRLALLMARNSWLSRRAIARAAVEPRTLAKLLAINCGYRTFAELSPRDWISLLGV
jgi:flavin-dependent dehydrogenase